jgi:hypothetical protein
MEDCQYPLTFKYPISGNEINSIGIYQRAAPYNTSEEQKLKIYPKCV